MSNVPFWKAEVVENMDRPFEVVDKSERRSPLKENSATRCDHDRAYKTDKFPTSGPRFICVDCGFGSCYPEDLE